MKVVIILAQSSRDGKHQIAQYCMDDAGCLIGRQCDQIRLLDEQCSRHHAIFYLHDDGTLWLKDLGSRNGTLVDGKPIREERIERGSRIRIGDVELQLRDYRVVRGVVPSASTRPYSPRTVSKTAVFSPKKAA